MIVVTAPTAKIGRRVVAGLLAASESVRVVARDPRRLDPVFADRIEVVTGSHRDGVVLSDALAGADALFWLMPADPEAADAMAAYVEASRPAVQAVEAAAVQHVVGVSGLGRGTAVAGRAGNVTGSLAMDELFATVTNYRALANASFMDNTLRQVAGILGDGSISGPIPPDRAEPLVATRDIAEAAVGLLHERGWTGLADVPLLGPADLSGNDMAAVITEVLDAPVHYRQVTPDSIERSMVDYGVSPGMARALADMAAAKIDGLDHGVNRAAAAPTPTTFRQWCTDTLRPAVEAARS